MYSTFFHKIYSINNKSLRKGIIAFVKKLEGGEFYSITLRSILETYHNVKIGLYSHGGCFVPGQVDPQTEIGRYCSIARNCRIFNRNHPVDFKSMHAFFFNSKLGYCKEDIIAYAPLLIGHDVWICHNANILPKVSTIGIGAVVGAGSIVTHDIPPYAIVVGNPAKIIRYRFSEQVIEQILLSKWWEMSMDEIEPIIKQFQQPYTIRNNK